MDKYKFDYNISNNDVDFKLTSHNLVGHNCDTDLADTFFHQDNLRTINTRLINKVFEHTKGKVKIPLQNERDLLIVCRYVYVQYAKNLPNDIKGQIDELNCKVIAEIFPDVISNIKQQIKYLEDISKPYTPMPPPMNVNNLDKTLPSMSEKLQERSSLNKLMF